MLSFPKYVLNYIPKRRLGWWSELEVAESDLNPIWSIFLRKSNWPDPIRTRPDPTRPDPIRDQMIFNPIKIYQRSEKTQHINWPDPIRSNLISSKKSNWPDPSNPNPNLIRPARLPPLIGTIFCTFLHWNTSIFFVCEKSN
jgi:hypothetical protein